MKVKYLRLSKLDKKKAQKLFYETDKGIIIRKNLRNANICSILSILYIIYLLWEYIFKNRLFINLFLAITLTIFVITSFIVSRKIFVKAINQYVIDNKKLF